MQQDSGVGNGDRDSNGDKEELAPSAISRILKIANSRQHSRYMEEGHGAGGKSVSPEL